ncbi:MAG: carboxymuconolactone decarboxylase family protein [Amaricoccus sp.]
MSNKAKALNKALVALVIGGSLCGSGTFALAATDGANPDATADAAYAEMQAAFGKVPEFIKLFPKAAVAGAWAEVRDLEFNDKTALSAKEKALISLGVSAQIPCQYCIWEDTKSARDAGATDEEISEAVAVSALTRHWSTFFNGMAIDFDQFKADLGGR